MPTSRSRKSIRLKDLRVTKGGAAAHVKGGGTKRGTGGTKTGGTRTPTPSPTPTTTPTPSPS